MNILGLLSNSLNPAYNLATEEILLKEKQENFLFIYTDNPSIIVGKHQNAYAEINYKTLIDKGLPLYRRMSGGGTVYHDSGNLNFSYITTGKPGHLVDFIGFTNKIIDVLNDFGVNAYFGGRNDILINNKKISGNASHVYKNRVMHHGTLLYNSNLMQLSDVLKTDPSKYKDKAVKSVRSLVTNICEHSSKNMDFEAFKNFLYSKLTSSTYTLTQNDKNSINDLVETKYSKWEWNYGYSPDYTFTKRIKIIEQNLLLEISFTVIKGIIKNINIKSNKKNNELIVIFEKLIECKHEMDSICEKISNQLKINFKIENTNSVIMQLF
ncbi:MAG: lipoate--protein ligase family protein [Bacteroidales bacterium]|nr:lipoate--protein ligase family protein [Bacteroidales bacterium]